MVQILLTRLRFPMCLVIRREQGVLFGICWFIVDICINAIIFYHDKYIQEWQLVLAICHCELDMVVDTVY